jgi:adenine-specific DNA-methyltransferase
MKPQHVVSKVAPKASDTNGVVYTRPWTVDLILNLAGYRPERNLVDVFAVEPAAGDGAFLVPMVERLIESCRGQGRPIRDCADSLRAYELDYKSADTARRRVGEKLAALGASGADAADLARAWIRRGDFLLEAGGRSGASLFPDETSELLIGGIDFVVGNPPYIRLEDIPAEKNVAYRSLYPTMTGRADIYVAFFEAALRHLRPGGVCAFICADRWMLNQYGAGLRRLITSGYGVEAVVEMHNALAFESEVSAYPAVTVIRRGPQRRAVVARADASAESADAAQVADSLRRYRESSNGKALPGGIRACQAETWFAGEEPWPCTSPERLALLKRLEREFGPLESKETGTRVGIGVASGSDKVFITRDPEVVEPDRLLPLAVTADTSTGTFVWSGHYLVNPWSDSGLVSLADFPRLREYFEVHRQQLEARNVTKRDPRNWYRTIDRVHCALTERPKLYIQDIKSTIHPVLDRGETYPHHNLYVVTSEGWNLEVLGGLLMSDVGRFFVECYGVRMRGGYLRMQAQYLRRIRLPRPQDVSAGQKQSLAEAFRRRDVGLATRVALDLYGIDRLPVEA